MLTLVGIGAALGALARSLESPFAWSSTALAAVALLALFVLLNEGAATLFDPTDAAVAAPLPVRPRTLFAARLLAVGAGLLLPVGLVALPAGVVAATAHGPVAGLLAFPILALGSCLGVLGGFATVYALVLRAAGPARAQRVVTAAQVFGGGAVYGGILFGLHGGASALAAAVDVRPELVVLLPPANLGAVYGALLGEEVRWLGLHAALAAALPVVAGGLALALVSREFGRALLGDATLPGVRGAGWPGGWRAWLGARVNSPGPGRAGFLLAAAMSRRDTAFVRAAYGTLVMQVVVAAAIVFGGRSGEISPRLGVAAMLYMVAAQLPWILQLAAHGPERDALLPLRSLDAAGLRRYQAGALRGLVLGTAAPFLLLAAVLMPALLGLETALDAVLAACIGLVMILVFARRMTFPALFTQGPMRRNATTQGLGQVWAFALGMAGGFLLHLPFFLHPLAPLVGIPVALLVAGRLVRSLDDVRLKRRGWAGAGL